MLALNQHSRVWIPSRICALAEMAPAHDYQCPEVVCKNLVSDDPSERRIVWLIRLPLCVGSDLCPVDGRIAREDTNPMRGRQSSVHLADCSQQLRVNGRFECENFCSVAPHLLEFRWRNVFSVDVPIEGRLRKAGAELDYDVIYLLLKLAIVD